MYGADWCSDCVTVKNFLTMKGIPFEYIVITHNADAIAFLEKINNGKQIIPTLDINGKICFRIENNNSIFDRCFWCLVSIVYGICN